MKNLLTEKNLMWVAIAVLAVLQFCPASLCGADKDCRPDSMRQKMSQMRDRMGSRGDAGRGAWTGPRTGGNEARGEKKRPKDSK
tara:strand:+ start:330 stop:581 length:252 start_codon:yes stop_codon:yes gene_type:complete